MSILHTLRCLAVLGMVATGTASAAKVDPPTIALSRPTTSIVVADYREAGPGDRLVFSRVRTVRSPVEVPELIDLAKPDLHEPLVAGKRYLLAYTVFANDKMKRTSPRARGGAFLSSPGLEPPLWDFSDSNEQMVTWHIADEVAGMQAAMPRLLKLLASSESRQRAFAAAEIAYRPALLGVLSASEQKALQKFVHRDAGPDRARAVLMMMAYNMPDLGSARRSWDGTARDLLADSPLLTRDQDGHTQLLLAAFSHLQARDSELSPKIARRWLHADDMALVEAAASALQRSSSTLARNEIGAALRAADLSSGSREVLLQALHRLPVDKTAL